MLIIISFLIKNAAWLIQWIKDRFLFYLNINFKKATYVTDMIILGLVPEPPRERTSEPSCKGWNTGAAFPRAAEDLFYLPSANRRAYGNSTTENRVFSRISKD